MPDAPPRIADDRPLPVPFDATVAADRVTELLATDRVRGSFWLWLFRRVLGWALRRTRGQVARSCRETSWLSMANGWRLNVPSLPELSWTAVLEDDGGLDEISRAAALVVEALRFRAELLAPTCPVRRVEQCGPLFHTTLIPHADRFEMHRGRGRHVLVGVDGALHAVDVLEQDGTVREESEIARDFRACVARGMESASPLLALSALPRGDAAAIWPELALANPAAVESLREAVFCVFFDSNVPADTDACGRLAQGGRRDSRSFWHALQIVAFRNGKVALVGSWVAGIEGEGGMEICSRLGGVRQTKKNREQKKRSPTSSTPTSQRPLVWTIDPEKARVLAALANRPPTNVGGVLRAPRFGRSQWTRAGVNPEAAIVVALRLALDTIAPDLDDLDCMVNLAHFQEGSVRRTGTNTRAMTTLVRAAREPDADLGSELALALAAHRSRIRTTKRLETPELMLEFSIFAFKHLSRFARWIVRLTAGGLGVALSEDATPAGRMELSRPRMAVDSSVPLGTGVAVFGRFGVPAPQRSIWIHHSMSEDETRFVLQLGGEHLKNANQLREAIPTALARVLKATQAHRRPLPVEVDGNGAATPRIVYRQLVNLMASLRDSA
jgi:hypothetical protein